MAATAPPPVSSTEEEDLEKATAARQFFEDYYTMQGSYLRMRAGRQSACEEAIKALPPPEQEAKRQEFFKTERNLLRSRRRRVKVGDFQIIRMIGKGGYGEVYLARKQDTSEVLALKKMKKVAILKSQTELTHLRTERNVLAGQESAWLVQLIYSFQDEKHVYMAMEFVGGGDVRTRLTQADTLGEPEARFYIAEMFMAVNALHQKGYIHRDLKPENFLIDSGGHIKLTDFGLSKGNMETVQSKTMNRGFGKMKEGDKRTIKNFKQIFNTMKGKRNREMAYSMVGSPEYMAVEMLRGDGYDFTVDYWALACILFEMLIGFSPFADDDIESIFRNIFNHQVTLNFPDIYTYMSHDGWEFISGVLQEPATRLGKEDFRAIKSHKFFAGIDFENIRSTRPAFVPDLSNIEDTRYFDAYEETETADAEAEDADEEERARIKFQAFTFKRGGPPTPLAASGDLTVEEAAKAEALLRKK